MLAPCDLRDITKGKGDTNILKVCLCIPRWTHLPITAEHKGSDTAPGAGAEQTRLWQPAHRGTRELGRCSPTAGG